jgi:hypothetical protein
MTDTIRPRTALRLVKAVDDARPSMPAEHTSVLVAGAATLWAALRTRSVPGKLVLSAAALALFARGLSGRDGPLARARRATGGSNTQ